MLKLDMCHCCLLPYISSSVVQYAVVYILVLKLYVQVPVHVALNHRCLR